MLPRGIKRPTLPRLRVGAQNPSGWIIGLVCSVVLVVGLLLVMKSRAAPSTSKEHRTQEPAIPDTQSQALAASKSDTMREALAFVVAANPGEAHAILKSEALCNRIEREYLAYRIEAQSMLGQLHSCRQLAEVLKVQIANFKINTDTDRIKLHQLKVEYDVAVNNAVTMIEIAGSVIYQRALQNNR